MLIFPTYFVGSPFVVQYPSRMDDDDGKVKKISLFGDDDGDEDLTVKKSLLGDEDDATNEGIDENEIQVNQRYATNLLRRKREGELHTMRRKFGLDEDDEDLSSGETSDEDGWMLSDKKKIEIASVIDAAKHNDPSLLERDEFFYDSESGSSTDGGDLLEGSKRKTYNLKVCQLGGYRRFSFAHVLCCACCGVYHVAFCRHNCMMSSVMRMTLKS